MAKNKSHRQRIAKRQQPKVERKPAKKALDKVDMLDLMIRIERVNAVLQN